MNQHTVPARLKASGFQQIEALNSLAFSLFLSLPTFSVFPI